MNRYVFYFRIKRRRHSIVRKVSIVWHDDHEARCMCTDFILDEYHKAESIDYIGHSIELNVINPSFAD